MNKIREEEEVTKEKEKEAPYFGDGYDSRQSSRDFRDSRDITSTDRDRDSKEKNLRYNS